eukprot:1611001-Prymnesium_polylepis.1
MSSPPSIRSRPRRRSLEMCTRAAVGRGVALDSPSIHTCAGFATQHTMREMRCGVPSKGGSRPRHAGADLARRCAVVKGGGRAEL